MQAAWAASHTKKTYLAAQYRRLVGRRGKKRALIAVGHSMLVIFYHMLKDGTPYADLGATSLTVSNRNASLATTSNAWKPSAIRSRSKPASPHKPKFSEQNTTSARPVSPAGR